MKDFDLEHIGKRMPYSVPEGFFETFPDRMMQRVALQRRARRRRLWLGLSTGIAAAFVAGFFFWGGRTTDDLYPAEPYGDVTTSIAEQMDAYVSRLSDEELTDLYDYYAADVTLTLYMEE